MTSVGNQEANFATCQRLALEAKEAGCCMLFLPECCSFIGRNQQEVFYIQPSTRCKSYIGPAWTMTIWPARMRLQLPTSQTVSVGEPLSGPAMARFQDLAKRTGMWLSLGGFQETGPDTGHIYNTHVVLNADGALVTSYRKVCAC